MSDTSSPPVQRKDGVTAGSVAPPHPASHRKTEARRKIFRELVHMAAEQGAAIELGVSTAGALQECLDRAVALYRFAADQVDRITPPDGVWEGQSLADLPVSDDPLFEVMPNPQGPDLVTRHRYFLMEQEARLEIEKLASMMTTLGIAERVVRVEEAKAALLIAAVREAAMDIGLTHDQVRDLGAALRRRADNGLGQMKSAPSHGTGEVRKQQAVLAQAVEVLD